MNIVGCDLSMNASGITKFKLDKDLNVIEKDYLAFTTTKKYETNNVTHYSKKQFKDGYEKNWWMLDIIMGYIGDVDYIAFEDYSLASQGKVFDIAEFSGLIRQHLYKTGTPLRFYVPGQIKKYATGNGSADKIRMAEHYDLLTYEEKFDVSFLPPTKTKSCKEDIIDSYYIAKLLQLELKVRKGMIIVKDLTDKQREIFNHTSKKYTENLLVRPFLQDEKII